MNIANENTKPATPETMPEYLDRLAADQIAAGMDATGADIKAAADEIRRLDRKLVYSQAAEEIADQKLGNLSDAILAIINIELESKIEEIVESKIADALDDYDPTDHYNFADAVTEHASEADADRTREIVREVLEGGTFTFHD